MRHQLTQLHKSTWIAIAAIVSLLLIVMIVSPTVPRVLLSLSLVLFLPGLLITLLLFPGESLGIPERLLLSFGLSVAFVALGGLILNLTPWGLQASSLWIALLLSLAVGIAVLFYARRTGWRVTIPNGINFNKRQWVLMVLAALMTILSIRIARTPAPQTGLEGYTLLSAQTADLPNTIRLGVKSEEFASAQYQIKYQYNGMTQEGPTLNLNPGQSWEQVVPIPVEKLGGKSFTILLYRLDRPTEVYRHVIWWPEAQ